MLYSDFYNYDTAFLYYNKSLNIAEKYSNKEVISKCYLNIGNLYNEQGNYEMAIQYYKNSLVLKNELNEKKDISMIYNNLGNCYLGFGNYDKSIDYYLKSINIKEELNDIRGIAISYNNIGRLFYRMGYLEKAHEYFTKSIEKSEIIGEQKEIAIALINIGNIYNDIYNNDEAMKYYLKGLKFYELLNDKKGSAATYSNIALLYSKQNINTLAIEFQTRSIKIDIEIGNIQGLAIGYCNLASYNIGLADSLIFSNNQSQIRNNLLSSITYSNKALSMANDLGVLHIKKSAIYNLICAYRKLGNHQKALEFVDIFNATRDSLFNEEKTKGILEVETKYQAEKKQLQIEKMEKQKLLDDKTIEVQHAQNRKQLVIIFSAFIGFIIVLVFSVIVMRMLQQKRRANRLLAQQNEEINQQKEEITAQRDEIEAQRNLVVEQKEHLEEVHKEIKDSINYAKRIQTSAMPDLTRVKNHFNDFFMLFKPKDVVSGDFYWFAEVENQLVITVADCTGHGVPGAFMSILGMSILKEIVVKEYITQPDVILRKLRKEVVRALSQKGEPGEQKDGMDMSLCSINTVTKYLQWSGANNPLILIRKGELSEIKPDKMPIAIYEKMDRFTLHEFQLKQGDQIYLIGDGYPDQFGGPKGKKIMSKNLKELLLKISNEPMNLQKKILEDKLYDWMNNYGVKYEQIDDITIMGIKI